MGTKQETNYVNFTGVAASFTTDDYEAVMAEEVRIDIVDTLRSSACHLRQWAESRECVLLGSEHSAAILADRLDRYADRLDEK